jgi:hypothetical protein
MERMCWSAGHQSAKSVTGSSMAARDLALQFARCSGQISKRFDFPIPGTQGNFSDTQR